MTAVSTPLPTAADLDAHASEQSAKQATLTPAEQFIHDRDSAWQIRANALQKLESDLSAYRLAKAVEEDGKSKAAALKPGIVAIVTAYGSVPDGAPKSRRIETECHLATITVGTTLEIDDDAALTLEQLMNKLPRRFRKLFPQIFRKRYEYALEPSARDIILGTKWPDTTRDAIFAAYLRCVSAKSGNPSLSVDSLDEIAEKQRKAEEELAAKAVRKPRGSKAAA